MKYYLSSYKFGNEVEKLKLMLSKGAKIGHIDNAKDWTTANYEIKDRILKKEMEFLNELGFENEHLDLKNYFGKINLLRTKIEKLDGVWVSGGNTFVLRQAMNISEFDIIFQELKSRKDFFYGGYSAGICVLCDSLKYIQHVDNPSDFPYRENKAIIFEGLNVFKHGILPHYKSNHPESEEVEKEVIRCIDNKWLFITMKDGEVIIREE